MPSFLTIVPQKIVVLGSRKPRLTIRQDWNSADRGCSTRNVTSTDNSSVLFVRLLEIGRPGCRSATMKRRLSKFESLRIQSYNQYEVQIILGQECYVIHHPLEFKKSGDIAGVTIGFKLLSGLDLLHILIWIIFCFREHQIALISRQKLVVSSICCPK